MSIEIHSINKSFGSFVALEDISFHVPSGELVALLGPSGSGKTTLLRIIAGLDFADSGSIIFNGIDATVQSPQHRGVGFVFQHYALFRHMNILENVAFGLRVKPRKLRPSRTEISTRAHELLRLVQLDGLAHRYPSQLSGGQRQRVALARALAVEPQTLLLDEPFGALDAKVRKELRRWMRRLHDEIHLTSVFVTHDVDEALEVADRVVVMRNGKMEQVGTPDEVYDNPASPFVFEFMGPGNVLETKVHEGRASIGQSNLEAPHFAHLEHHPALGFVRPHEVQISREPSFTDSFVGTIKECRMLGPAVRIQLSCPGLDTLLEAEILKSQWKEMQLNVGERVYVATPQVKLFVPDYCI